MGRAIDDLPIYVGETPNPVRESIIVSFGFYMQEFRSLGNERIIRALWGSTYGLRKNRNPELRTQAFEMLDHLEPEGSFGINYLISIGIENRKVGFMAAELYSLVLDNLISNEEFAHELRDILKANIDMLRIRLGEKTSSVQKRSMSLALFSAEKALQRLPDN